MRYFVRIELIWSYLVQKTFSSLDEANAFYEASEDARSIVSNYPAPGKFTVHLRPALPTSDAQALMEKDIQALLRSFQERESRLTLDFEQSLRKLAALHVAEDFLSDHDLAPGALEVFAAGIAGDKMPPEAKLRSPSQKVIFMEGHRLSNDKAMQDRLRNEFQALRKQYAYTDHFGFLGPQPD